MTCLLCRLKTTDVKAPICKNGPCQICTTLTQVDEEINEAVATLRRLFSKRCDILSEHNRVHGLIQRLPIELKNCIFELLLPSESQDGWGQITGTGMHSFLSSISVCKGWRDIALSNPFLWSKIHIDLRKPMSSRRINDWILRSQALPLTLHIEVYKRTVGPEPVLDALSRCSNRLQSLSLDVPLSLLGGLQHDNFQYHRLTQLQIISSQKFDQPLSLLNSTAIPEKIYLEFVSFRSLQISWNRLVSATVNIFDLKDLTQLFQHASQMTFCQISILRRGPNNFSMPPIIHHNLKTLDLSLSSDWRMAPGPLDSFTLPCLQEVEISEVIPLTQLPALVRRSSCPLTKLTLYLLEFPFDDLQPFPGMTHLVVRSWSLEGGAMMRFLDGYFPDLRHLTLHVHPFMVLWNSGVIPLLLDRKRPQPDGPNEGRLEKLTVVGKAVLNSDVGEILKELNATLREDGFEFF